MATFNGTTANETFAGTSVPDLISNGGGVDSLSGAGSDDLFIMTAQPGNNSVFDGGTGTDTFRVQNFTTQGTNSASGLPITSISLLTSGLFSFERIEFVSAANSIVSATFGLVGTAEQFTADGISPTATIAGGEGRDQLILFATVAQGATVTVPTFTYLNWTTPTRAYLTGDQVLVSATGNGFTLIGSPHAGVQALSAIGRDLVVIGSDDMDLIRLAGTSGTPRAGIYRGSGGDDAFTLIDTITVTYASNGQAGFESHSGEKFAGSIDGGTGFDFLVLGGQVDASLVTVSNVEGLYLAPGYAPVVTPGGTSQRQNNTSVSLASGWLEAYLPAGLKLAGNGAITVNMVGLTDTSGFTPADTTFSASGYTFDDDAVIALSIVGSAFADVIEGSVRADTIDAGTGRDIVVYRHALSDYTVSQNTAGDLLVSGPDGADTLRSVEILRFVSNGVSSDYMWSTTQNALVPAKGPSVGTFRMFAGDGFTGSIGGNGQVIGTNAVQTVWTVGDNDRITFDGSFNRGNDTIRLPGDATEFTGASQGASAILADGISSYTIPAGSGATILFDDETRNLRIDTVANPPGPALDSQVFLASPSQILPGTPVTNPVSFTPAGSARIFLTDQAVVDLGGNYKVFGSNGANTLTWLSGNLELDASFNRGGDTLIVDTTAQSVQAWQSSSNIVLKWGNYTATIPYGTAGLALAFDSPNAADTRSLHFDLATTTLLIGDQAITATSQATAITLHPFA